MKWDKTYRKEYQRLYYKIRIAKIKCYTEKEFERFLEMGGKGFHKKNRIPIEDLKKNTTEIKMIKKKTIITFD